MNDCRRDSGIGVEHDFRLMMECLYPVIISQGGPQPQMAKVFTIYSVTTKCQQCVYRMSLAAAGWDDPAASNQRK